MPVELLHLGIDFAFIAVWAIVGQIIIGDRRSRQDPDASGVPPRKPAIIVAERIP